MNIPRQAAFRQTARHEAAHAVAGFVQGLAFQDDAVFVAATQIANQLEAGETTFHEPWNDPLSTVRVALAGPMYESLLLSNEPSTTEAQSLCGAALYDSRNAAFGLGLWLHAHKFRTDLPLRELVLDTSSLDIRDWTTIADHPNSPVWRCVATFHVFFIASLSSEHAPKPVCEHGQAISTLCLLQWLASETGQLLKHTKPLLKHSQTSF